MKPIMLVLALVAAFYYTDLDADNAWQGTILPIIDFLLLCAVAIWIATGVGNKRLGGGDGGFFDFFDGGGDGGGCD